MFLETFQILQEEISKFHSSKCNNFSRTVSSRHWTFNFDPVRWLFCWGATWPRPILKQKYLKIRCWIERCVLGRIFVKICVKILGCLVDWILASWHQFHPRPPVVLLVTPANIWQSKALTLKKKKQYPPGNGYISHLGKGKSSTQKWRLGKGICSYPKPESGMTNRLFLVPTICPESCLEARQKYLRPWHTVQKAPQLSQHNSNKELRCLEKCFSKITGKICWICNVHIFLAKSFVVHQLPFWEFEWIWWNWFQLHKFHFHFRHERNFLSNLNLLSPLF